MWLWLEELAATENLDMEALQKIVTDYLYTGRPPLSKEIGETMKERPTLLLFRKKVKRIIDRIIDLVEQFEDGVGDAPTTTYEGGDLMGMAADDGE